MKTKVELNKYYEYASPFMFERARLFLKSLGVKKTKKRIRSVEVLSSKGPARKDGGLSNAYILRIVLDESVSGRKLQRRVNKLKESGFYYDDEPFVCGSYPSDHSVLYGFANGGLMQIVFENDEDDLMVIVYRNFQAASEDYPTRDLWNVANLDWDHNE